MLKTIFKNVQANAPLVHCMTNYVTVNDCANIVLASGGSPIMADDIQEVEDITTICNSLVINIGTLNERTIAAMLKAGKKANELGHPVILDPVGAGASKLRTDTAFALLDQVKFSVIRGNLSEIKTIRDGHGKTKGVDADQSDQMTGDVLGEIVQLAKNLSQKTGAIIAITGENDVIADQDQAYIVSNGHPMMARITGSGCMLSCVIGAYCAPYSKDQKQILHATAAAVTAMGLCGELAYDKTRNANAGTASFRTYLIDSMSTLTSEQLEEGAKIAVQP